MKKLLSIFLLLSCSSCLAPAYAEEFVERELYATNADGGLLTITNVPCDALPLPKPDVKWYNAFTEDVTNGATVQGCWLFAVDYPAIIIYWKNGFKSVIENPGAFHQEKPQLQQEQEKKQDTF